MDNQLNTQVKEKSAQLQKLHEYAVSDIRVSDSKASSLVTSSAMKALCCEIDFKLDDVTGESLKKKERSLTPSRQAIAAFGAAQNLLMGSKKPKGSEKRGTSATPNVDQTHIQL